MACPPLTKLHASNPLEDFLHIIDRDGAVIISGLMLEEELRNLQEELNGDFERANFCIGSFFGSRTKRTHSLVVKSETCRAMIMKTLILQIMESLLGPFCDKIQLSLTQGIQIWPGEIAQFLHRDDSIYPSDAKNCHFMVNALWAYSEFSSKNGGTIVAPGSHKWKDLYRLPEDHEITQAEMRQGEVLIYLGSVIHGGGANHSSTVRTGIAFSYCLGWLRQYENQYLVAPPEIAKNFPKQLQDLLGYCVHRPNMGLYEGNEPSVLFRAPHEIQTQDFLTEEGQNLVDTYRENTITQL